MKLITAVFAFLCVITLYSCEPLPFNGAIIHADGFTDFKTLGKGEGFNVRLNENSFTSLIEFMKSRRVVKFLTYRLLIHDLNKEVKKYEHFDVSTHEASKLVDYMESRLKDYSDDNIDEIIEKQIENLALKYNYDCKSLSKQLEIERIGETDQISIDFLSDNSALSYFAINAYAKDFIAYYIYHDSQENQRKVKFYKRVISGKETILAEKNEVLRNYLDENNLTQITKQRNDIALFEKELLVWDSITKVQMLEIEEKVNAIKIIKEATKLEAVVK